MATVVQMNEGARRICRHWIHISGDLVVFYDVEVEVEEVEAKKRKKEGRKEALRPTTEGMDDKSRLRARGQQIAKSHPRASRMSVPSLPPSRRILSVRLSWFSFLFFLSFSSFLLSSFWYVSSCPLLCRNHARKKERKGAAADWARLSGPWRKKKKKNNNNKNNKTDSLRISPYLGMQYDPLLWFFSFGSPWPVGLDERWLKCGGEHEQQFATTWRREVGRSWVEQQQF